MSFANKYGFNKKLAEDGAWVSMGDGLEHQVRRSNSKFVRDFVVKENKKHANLTRGGRELPQDIADMVSRRVVSCAMLVDWRDTPKGESNPNGEIGAPRDERGNIIPFTPEAALEYCLEYPDFMEDVVTQSSNIENYRAEERKAIEGNS